MKLLLLKTSESHGSSGGRWADTQGEVSGRASWAGGGCSEFGRSATEHFVAAWEWSDPQNRAGFSAIIILKTVIASQHIKYLGANVITKYVQDRSVENYVE